MDRGPLHISEGEDDPVVVLNRKMKEMKVEFDSKIGSLQTNIDVLRTDVKTEITSVRSSLDSMKTASNNNFANILACLPVPVAAPAPVAATPAPAATPRPTTNPRGIEQDDGWISEEEMDTALDQPLMAPSFITQQEMERTVNMGNPVFQSYGFVTTQVKEALAERAMPHSPRKTYKSKDSSRRKPSSAPWRRLCGMGKYLSWNGCSGSVMHWPTTP